MTGLYPQQTGVTWNGHCLPHDFRPSVASVFGGMNYQTNQIGKLHFPAHEEHDLDPRPQNTYGFDIYWPSTDSGGYEDAYMTWLRTEYPEYVETCRIHRASSPTGWIVEQAARLQSQNLRRNAQQFTHLGFCAPHPGSKPRLEGAFAGLMRSCTVSRRTRPTGEGLHVRSVARRCVTSPNCDLPLADWYSVPRASSSARRELAMAYRGRSVHDE